MPSLSSSVPSGLMLPSSPEVVSVLLIIATNFPATFLARFLSSFVVCHEVRVGDGVDVLGVGVEPAPDPHVCLPIAPRCLGLVAPLSAGGSSA